MKRTARRLAGNGLGMESYLGALDVHGYPLQAATVPMEPRQTGQAIDPPTRFGYLNNLLSSGTHGCSLRARHSSSPVACKSRRSISNRPNSIQVVGLSALRAISRDYNGSVDLAVLVDGRAE